MNTSACSKRWCPGRGRSTTSIPVPMLRFGGPPLAAREDGDRQIGAARRTAATGTFKAP